MYTFQLSILCIRFCPFRCNIMDTKLTQRRDSLPNYVMHSYLRWITYTGAAYSTFNVQTPIDNTSEISQIDQ